MAEKPKKKASGLGWAAFAAAVAVGGHFVAKSPDEPTKTNTAPLEERVVSTDCLEALSSATSTASKNGVSAFEDALRQLNGFMQEVDAQDLAMDAMLRVCTTTPSGSLRSYYFGAINKMKANPFRRALRDARKKERYAVDPHNACPAPTVDPLDMVASTEMQNMIDAWLVDLTPEEVDLLNKHIFQEMSFRQIEEKDGTASSTLYDRWAKVREKLQTQIFVCNVTNDPKAFLKSVTNNVNSAR